MVCYGLHCQMKPLFLKTGECDLKKIWLFLINTTTSSQYSLVNTTTSSQYSLLYDDGIVRVGVNVCHTVVFNSDCAFWLRELANLIKQNRLISSHSMLFHFLSIKFSFSFLWDSIIVYTSNILRLIIVTTLTTKKSWTGIECTKSFHCTVQF